MAARPLGVTGVRLLEALRLTKGPDSFMQELNTNVQPVMNFTPYMAAELSYNYYLQIVGPGLGFSVGYTNTTNLSQLCLGCAVTSGPVGAGNSIEIRPCVRSSGQPGTEFHGAIGVSDFAGGATENLCSGGLFINDPIILLPGWSIGCWVSTLVGASPAVNFMALFSPS